MKMMTMTMRHEMLKTDDSSCKRHPFPSSRQRSKIRNHLFKVWRCPSSFFLLVLIVACGCFFHPSLLSAAGFSLSASSTSKMSQLPPEKEVPKAAPAPLYITIGPPCAGKSTWIRHNGSPPSRNRKSSSDKDDSTSSDDASAAVSTTAITTNGQEKKKPEAIRDVALDDQVGVWNPIPTALFLQQQTDLLKDDDPHWKTTIKFGQTIGARIQKDEETRLIAQRCAEQLSPEEFGSALSLLYNNNNNRAGAAAAPSHILSTVLECYESVLKQHKESSACAASAAAKVASAVLGEATNSEGAKTEMKARQTTIMLYPNTTDLYVSEAIFRRHLPELNRSGLESALHVLANAPIDQAVAWGNTNTQCRDYKEALQIAARQGRPVHFVLYNASSDVHDYYYYQNQHATSSSSVATFNSDNAAVIVVPSELESIGFPGLLRNNLRRYLETGRYIPARAVWLMVERTASLIDSVAQTWSKNTEIARSPPTSPPTTATATTTNVMSTLERDQLLVSLAGGIEMKNDRTIVVISQTTTTTTTTSSSPLRHSRQRPSDNDHRNVGNSNWSSNKRHRGLNHHHHHPDGRHGGRGRGRGAYQQQQSPRYQWHQSHDGPQQQGRRSW